MEQSNVWHGKAIHTCFYLKQDIFWSNLEFLTHCSWVIFREILRYASLPCWIILLSLAFLHKAEYINNAWICTFNLKIAKIQCWRNMKVKLTFPFPFTFIFVFCNKIKTDLATYCTSKLYMFRLGGKKLQ